MDAQQIISAIRYVTARWATQKKKEEKENSSWLRRREALTTARRVSIKQAAYAVMADAYLKASSGGTLPAHARQIMYAARGPIQERTGRTLNDKYFIQTLLVDYMREHPYETAAWDVVHDARGHLCEPHTGLSVDLGTIGVRDYCARVDHHKVNGLSASQVDSAYPTVGPKHRFGAILLFEKEGFNPLIGAVGLAERYDVAVMSTKGLSSTAGRQLVDERCGQDGVPLFVVRDFDKAGFSIAGTLQRDTRRYSFNNDLNVIDLGLRLEDVLENDLESEDVSYGKSDPTANLLKNGATKEEIDFLLRGESAGIYHGQRVELNAFTSKAFVDWLERKLRAHGVKKVIPDPDTVTDAWHRIVQAEYVNDRLPTLLIEAEQKTQDVEAPTREDLKSILDEHPELPWDEALNRLRKEAEE